MSRNDFFKKLGRFLLLLVTAVVAMALRKRIVTERDCSACPGNGICNGRTDCSDFWIEKKWKQRKININHDESLSEQQASY
jgi:hypothetical protein